MQDGAGEQGGSGSLTRGAAGEAVAAARGDEERGSPRRPERREAELPLSPTARQQSEAAASLAALGAGPSATRRRPAEDDAYVEATKVSRARLNWSPELHGRFLAAVQHLGVNTAVPKTILQARARKRADTAPISPEAVRRLTALRAFHRQLMNVDGMTRENVASHLQKYRLALRKAAGVEAHEALPEDAIVRFGSTTPAPAEPDAAAAAGIAGVAALPPLPPQHAAGAAQQPQRPHRRTSNHGLTSQELSSIATSATYEAMFAPGAGTRPPPPAVLSSFILGASDTFAPARMQPATANNPPKPAHEEAADAPM